MKALLIALNAKYIHSNLALYSIRAFCLAHGVPEEDLVLAEYTINQSQGEILADIYRKEPQLLAFSCYIWNIRQVRELAAQLHQILPQVPIWLGGPEVSFQAEPLIRQYPWVTGIMVGEGEATFLELYQAYEGCQKESGGAAWSTEKLSLEGVSGLVYRRGADGSVHMTAPRELLSMDDLVFPYGDLEGLEHRIIYYETSRGCPFGCSYCLSSVDRRVRLRSISLVERELQFFLDRRVPQVKLVDRTFNCQKEHTMAIWKYLNEHDNGVTNFHFELSAELLTEEEITYLAQLRPGLVQFEIGVQSTNPDTLKAIHRPSDLTLLKQRVAAIRKNGNIHQHLDLIAGLPYEDFSSFRRSFNEVYGMKPDQLQLGFLKLLRGSPLRERQEEFGIVCQEEAPYEVLFTRWLSYADVLQLKLVEDMVERYYNSMQFQASLPYVIGHFPSAFDFYLQLGEYYREKGYFGLQSSRLQRYEILLDFCREKTGCEEGVLCQLFLYDLYAREKLKTRPAFLGEEPSQVQRDRSRVFYQNTKLRQIYLPEYVSYDWKQTARMTHLEYFDFQIWEYLSGGELIPGECVLLFDYQHRNPLSHQARITPVPEILC